MVQFTVKVIPFVNVAPNIDVIKDVTCGLNNKNLKHRIYFTGVNDGNDGSQTISKPVVTFSDATKLRLPYVNYTSPQTGGNLEFYPDALGTTTVTMNIQDNGGTDLGGKDMKTITFKITVVDSYQFNGMYDEYTDPPVSYTHLIIPFPDRIFSFAEGIPD